MSAGFACVVADPAWSFGDKLPGASRGAAKNYNVLSIDELCRLALPDIADDAYLFLWRVAAMQPEALRLVQSWNFTVKTELIWLKSTKLSKPWFGMGRHFRAAHETCLVATRGRPQRLTASLRSVFEAPVPVDAEGKYVHSAKPDRFFELIEQFCPGPRLELFSRLQRSGWVCIGDALGTRLAVRDESASASPSSRKFGSASGSIELAPDFDDPLVE